MACTQITGYDTELLGCKRLDYAAKGNKPSDVSSGGLVGSTKANLFAHGGIHSAHGFEALGDSLDDALLFLGCSRR